MVYFQSLISKTVICRALSVAALAALAGCSTAPDASPATTPDQFELNTLWLSGQCIMMSEAADVLRSGDPAKRINAPELVDEVFVIRGDTHWTSFWQSVNSATIDPPARPPVDFEKHSLVAVILKRQSRAGGGIELADSAATVVGNAASDLVEIPVNIQTPESGSMSAAVVTRPCVVIQTYPALPDDTTVSIVDGAAAD